MKTLYLGNDWNIHRDQIRDRGAPVPGPVTARGLIAASADGGAVHASLEVAGTVTDSEFAVVIQGTDLTTHLAALLDAAEEEGRDLVVFDRVIVDNQDYSDHVPVRVKRARPAGAP